jgi:FlaA1/EpsC-like NDP-sugar epimerase
MVLIAIPSATGAEMTRILELCHMAGVECRTVPGLGEMIEGHGLTGQIREVAVEDLLGRTPVRLEEGKIRATIEGKMVMVTGAAGSIGSELCRQIALFHPAGIVGFEIAESPLFEIDREMKLTFPHVPFHPEIGSIQNRASVEEVLNKYRPAAIYHAAAYKHVPLMEAHVFEAIENNVFGTYNVAAAAAENGVEDFVMISSDKAVRPTNVMGTTKRIAELIVACAAERPNQVRGGALRQRARLERQRDTHLQEADRGWRPGDGNASGDAPVLHDDSRSVPAGAAGRGHRQGRPDLRARHGTAGQDCRPGKEPDSAFGIETG